MSPSASATTVGPSCPSGVRVQASRCPRRMEPERHQLDGSLRATMRTSSHASDARLPSDSRRFEEQEFEHSSECDLVKQVVKRPIRLRNEEELTQRTRDNLEALGGMINPKKAVQRLPKHKSTGKLALDAMTQVILAAAAIGELILAALGDATKTNRGPS